MRVVTIRQPQRRTHKKRTRRLRLWLALLTVLMVGAGAFNYLRPVPEPAVVLSLPAVPVTGAPVVDWPDYGQASLTTASMDTVLTNGTMAPLSTASMAKVITALCVLEKYPLAPGETGPRIKLGEEDMKRYRMQVGLNGSNLPIYSGEELTEYQAIQALMIPSANNIADTLAVWAFGSLENYSTYSNAYVRRHGLINTRIGVNDASGLDPTTNSTAEDLAKLGLIALEHPVLREIFGQKSAVFPMIGELNNYNTKLGVSGIIGIKTGNNEQNPGALLYAASIPVGSSSVMITGAVMGARDLPVALNDTEALVVSVKNSFEQVSYLKQDQPVGHIRTAWGESSPLVATKDNTFVRWKGTAVTASTNDHKLTAIKIQAGQPVGAIEVKSGAILTATPIAAKEALSGPSFWWRLTRH